MEGTVDSDALSCLPGRRGTWRPGRLPVPAPTKPVFVSDAGRDSARDPTCTIAQHRPDAAFLPDSTNNQRKTPPFGGVFVSR